MTDVGLRLAPDAALTLAADAGLVGREREIGALGSLLATARMVTLTGPAGVGKSSLARALTASGGWAACAIADLGAEPDGGQARELLADCARRLADGGQADGGQALLVIDNCDRALGVVASLVPRLLAGQPRLRIVATARECVGVGAETVFPVRPLGPQDAAALFARRAAAQQAGLSPRITPQIRQICARLDGLPLAVELAAAQAKVLTAAQIAGRLDDALGLLAGGPRSSAVHHRSLRGAFDHWLEMLAEPERTLLRRLSVFAASFTLRAAEHVCAGPGLAEHEVLGALAGLAAKSFVSCDPSGEQARYRLMYTVRQYAAQLLSRAAESERVQRNRLDHAIACPAGLSPQDLAEALALCAGHDTADGLRLAAAAAPYWLLSGRLRQGARLLAGQLARGERAEGGGATDDDAYGRVVLAKGMFDLALGRADAAADAAERAAALCGRAGDTTGQLWADVLAGVTAWHADPQAGARRIVAAAAGLPAASPWTPVAVALHGLVAAEAGWLADAQEAAGRALAAARAGEEPRALVTALAVAGRVARKQGRLAAAGDLLDQARDLAASLEARLAEALIAAESARLALDRGSGRARAGPVVLDRGPEVIRAGEPALGRASGLALAGEPAMDRAVALATEVDSPLLLAAVLDVAGRSRLAAGQAPAARSAYAKVTALSRDTVTAQAVAGILGLGQVALAGGSASAAWTLIEEANALASAAAGPALLARTLQAVGDCASALGDASRAWSAFHQALGLRLEAGLSVAAVESLESLAGLSLNTGRTDYGIRLLGAADALRESFGSARGAVQRDKLDAERAKAIALLLPERYAELHAEGRRLSLQEAAAYARRLRAPRQRGVGWVSLTPAERQVADLAAAGLTNREIGQRLFSSPRTVQVHLSHVFAKLGISSRKVLAAELAARNRQLPQLARQTDG